MQVCYTHIVYMQFNDGKQYNKISKFRIRTISIMFKYAVQVCCSCKNAYKEDIQLVNKIKGVKWMEVANKLTTQELSLYGITDSSWLQGRKLAEDVEKALNGGVTILQYREKKLKGEELEQEAKEVLKVCRSHNIKLIINDDVVLARTIGADGVHLGQGDMSIQEARKLLGENKIIGITAKTIEQAQKAQQGGADYIGSGAVFGSTTKTDAKPMEHDLLDQICSSVDIPVVAIGGIDKTNIHQLKGRKMAGFAIVSGIFKSDNIEKSTKELKTIVDLIL